MDMDANTAYSTGYILGEVLAYIVFFVIATWGLSKVKTRTRIATCSFFILLNLIGFHFLSTAREINTSDVYSIIRSIGCWILVYVLATFKKEINELKKKQKQENTEVEK